MKSHHTKGNKTHSNYILGDLTYEVLEEHNNINRRELEGKERVYIENHKADMDNPVICINKNIPTQTHKEYSAKRYKENCEALKEKQKLYYWNNVEKERTRLKKHYQNVRVNVLQKRKDDIIFCIDCKKSMRRDTFARHKKSAQHIQHCFNKSYSDDGSKVI